VLDPEARELLDRMFASGWVPRRTLTPAEARAQLARTRAPAAGRELHAVYGRSIEGPGGMLPLRIYRPSPPTTPLPAVMFFHGGGWVLGDLDLSDGFCREIAAGADCVVVSVDYRLAPEHPFPAAIDDAMSATVWVADNAYSLGVDASAIAVCGISAGGNLAAVTALQARDMRGPDLIAQVLVCPVLDCSFERPSYRDNADGYLLERDDMRWFWDQYLPTEAWGAHPYASPMRATDVAGIAPAVVVTAEYDPLRDEGRDYADRLATAGVPVTYRCYDGMIHGFVGNAGMAKGRAALAELIVDLRLAFHRRDLAV
jgi:acetyl esterase